MANWLESEEQNKSNILQKEDLIHNNLKIFYDLCKRVENVRPGSLKISHLTVSGKRNYVIEPYVRYDDGFSLTNGRRGIKFHYSNAEELYVDILIHEEHRMGDMGDIDEWHTEQIISHKKCIPQDILDWDESKMLETIEWLLLERDSIIENLPG